MGFFPRKPGDLFLRKIDPGFQQGQEVGQIFADLLDLPAQPALTVQVGQFQGAAGFGLDQVDDRFGLGKVDPSVEKGPAGELPRLGQTGPATERRFQDFLENEDPAVGLDLGHILPGVGLGLGHEDRQDFVDHRPVLGPEDFS